jgi:hypothetical protein
LTKLEKKEKQNMAEITFTGFVQEWLKGSPQHPHWGMKVAETHQKKEGDEYKTVSRTYRTIKAGYETEIDFLAFKEGDRVTISGRELTEVSEKDGKKYYSLVVKATSVVLAESKRVDYASIGREIPVDDDPVF